MTESMTEGNNDRKQIQQALRELRHALHHCEMKLEYSDDSIEQLVVNAVAEIEHACRVITETINGPECPEEFVLDTPQYWDEYKKVVEGLTNQILSPRASRDKEPF